MTTQTAANKSTRSSTQALRAIAIFEAVKGLAALAAGLGLLSLLHHDLHHLAFALIGHFGLNPHGHLSALLLGGADQLQHTDVNVYGLAALLLAYITLRMAEAYGIWHERVWGEWLAALSGAIYLPFELAHWIQHPNGINAGVLLFNLLMVAFLVHRRWRVHVQNKQK